MGSDEVELIKKMAEASNALLEYSQRLEKRIEELELRFKQHINEHNAHFH